MRPMYMMLGETMCRSAAAYTANRVCVPRRDNHSETHPMLLTRSGTHTDTKKAHTLECVLC